MEWVGFILFISYPPIKRLHNLRLLFLYAWIQSTNTHYPVILLSRVSTQNKCTSNTHSHSEVGMGIHIWRWWFTYKYTLHRSQEMWKWLTFSAGSVPHNESMYNCTVSLLRWSVTRYTLLEEGRGINIMPIPKHLLRNPMWMFHSEFSKLFDKQLTPHFRMLSNTIHGRKIHLQ
jgi:hypothetical protein